MTLSETATTLLDAFVAQLETQQIAVPQTRYIAPGTAIAEDGEQLVLVLQGIDQGSPGKPEPGSFVPGSEILMAQFSINLLRTVPALSGEGFTGSMVPGGMDLGEAGILNVDDAEALVTAAMEIHAKHLVTEGGLQGFAIGACTPVGPEGGLAGSRLLLSINLG